MEVKEIQFFIREPVSKILTEKDVEVLPGYRVEDVQYQYEKNDDGVSDILHTQLKNTFADNRYTLKDIRIQILNYGMMWVTFLFFDTKEEE